MYCHVQLDGLIVSSTILSEIKLMMIKLIYRTSNSELCMKDRNITSLKARCCDGLAYQTTCWLCSVLCDHTPSSTRQSVPPPLPLEVAWPTRGFSLQRGLYISLWELGTNLCRRQKRDGRYIHRCTQL